MKTKLSLLLFLSFIFYLSTAQVPQGFNYQAIARDGTGNILPNTSLQAMMYVQSLSTGGTIFWKELHSTVTTNSFGLFTLVVGTGTRQPESTVATFNLIDWSVTPKYLKTEIYYAGSWKDMGTSQLMSVPYAMTSGDLAGTVDKLAVKGTTSALDEALFEVKNKNGQTIFAVYNEGVRIYVDDGAKGTKGGFAVGGFDMTKATKREYLVVSDDSIRMYLDNDPLTKGTKGGFAVGGFDMTKGSPVQNFLNVSADSVRIYVADADSKGVKGGFAVGGYDATKGLTQNLLMVSNDSVRVYVDNRTSDKGVKGGFAVGGYDVSKGAIQNLLTVSDDSVRIYIDQTLTKGVKGGFAVGGYDVTKGVNPDYLNVQPFDSYIINPSEPRLLWYPVKNAFLAGQVLIAHKDSIGLNSTTTGYESRAKGNWSQAMGYKAIARGLYSTAIGNQAVAHKNNSFALGESAYAGNVYSYAFGKSSKAKGDYAFAMGNNATASGYSSYAFGEGVTATNSYSYAFGKESSTGNSYAVAMGNGASAAGFSSYAFGEVAIANNQYSYAFGKGAKALQDYAFALGNTATASGANSFALGESVTASFPNSYAFGKSSSATANYAVAMGYGAQALGLSSFAIGGTASGESSKAFGGIASGKYALSSGFDATAAGDYSVAMGWHVQANGSKSFAFGMGDYSFPTTHYTHADGVGSIAMGSTAQALQNGSIAIGAGNTASGLGALSLGFNTTAQAAFSTVLGSYNVISGSTMNWVATEPLFVVANGDPMTGTPSNAMTILKNGYVGIGATSPSYPLELSNSYSGGYVAAFQNSGGTTTSNGIRVMAGNSTSGGAYYIAFLRPSGKGLYTTIGSITQNGADAVAYNTTSDARIKTKITETHFSIAELMKVKVRDFEFKDDPVERLNTGFVAQELFDVYPNAVTKPVDSKYLWQIDYGKMTPLIVKAVQDQQEEIESLKKTISKLEKIVEQLSNKK
jgi:hypothetical protein